MDDKITIELLKEKNRTFSSLESEIRDGIFTFYNHLYDQNSGSAVALDTIGYAS